MPEYYWKKWWWISYDIVYLLFLCVTKISSMVKGKSNLQNTIWLSFITINIKENEVVTFTEEILNGKLYFLVLWIQSSQNRLKLIQYFKDKIVSTWELFPQETHSSSKVEQKWKEYFKGNVFFFSRKNKFLWCPNCLLEKKLLLLKRKATDKEGRILILDVCVNDSGYILINLFIAKTKKEQINILINILLLEKFDINPKNYNYGGRF